MNLFQHQIVTRDRIIRDRGHLVFNDPGTGKTASVLCAIEHFIKVEGRGRALVLAPKAILEPAWVRDCHTFTPELTITPAYATNRRRAFETGSDIVVTNHDAVRWLTKNPDVLKGFDQLIIDESPAYKNKDSQRSRAIASLVRQFQFPIRVLMTGTPMPNDITDIWHQVHLVDDGEHLGNRFYAFRASTCDPTQVTHDIKTWVEKPGAREVVADLISPITTRYTFEECTDVPPNHETTRIIELPPALRKQYNTMLRTAVLEHETGDITAVHAAALITKLLQIASGTVYDAEHTPVQLDTQRADLIAELCSEREATLVGFQWRHQCDHLIEALERAGIDRYCVIDGRTSQHTPEIVRRFQAGEYQVCLAQPQSAAHGLTLTRARTCIWASPTWNSQHLQQFNRRIYRTGQTQRTETIYIEAADTVEQRVYAQVRHKLEGQVDLLALLQAMTTETTA